MIRKEHSFFKKIIYIYIYYLISYGRIATNHFAETDPSARAIPRRIEKLNKRNKRNINMNYID